MVALQDSSAATIISALETNLSILWRSYSRLPAAELCDQPDLFWVATDIPFPPFNGVVRAQLQPETITSTITATLQHFTRRHVPMLRLVTPSTQPPDLGTHLIEHGLTSMGEDPGMAIDLDRRLAALAPQAQHEGVVGRVGHGLLPAGCLLVLERVYPTIIDTVLTQH